MKSSTPERELLFRLHHIYRTLFLRHSGEPTDEFGDFTFAQMEVLRFVKKFGSVEMGELAKALEISPASASSLADRLVRYGCLERISDATDRRIVRLTLAPAAKQRMETMLDRKVAKLKAALKQLSKTERAQLQSTLSTLEKYLD